MVGFKLSTLCTLLYRRIGAQLIAEAHLNDCVRYQQQDSQLAVSLSACQVLIFGQGRHEFGQVPRPWTGFDRYQGKHCSVLSLH